MNPSASSVRHASFSTTAALKALQSSIRFLRWGLLILALVYLGSGVRIVGPNESALVLRFGRLLPKIHPPGLLLAFPPPIDEIAVVPVGVVQEIQLDAWAPPASFPERVSADALDGALNPERDGYALTGDANIIQARFSVRYRAADPVAYVLAARDRPRLLQAFLEQSISSVAATKGIDAILTRALDDFREASLREAQARVDRAGLGIHLLALEIRQMIPAWPVIPAFQEVISAQVEGRTLVEEANRYRSAEQPAADAQAYRVREEAVAAAQELTARSQGESAAFRLLLKKYQADPEVVRTRLYLETMEEVLPFLKTTALFPSGAGAVRILLRPGRVDAWEKP